MEPWAKIAAAWRMRKLFSPEVAHSFSTCRTLIALLVGHLLLLFLSLIRQVVTENSLDLALNNQCWNGWTRDVIAAYSITHFWKETEVWWGRERNFGGSEGWVEAISPSGDCLVRNARPLRDGLQFAFHPSFFFLALDQFGSTKLNVAGEISWSCAQLSANHQRFLMPITFKPRPHPSKIDFSPKAENGRGVL